MPSPISPSVTDSSEVKHVAGAADKQVILRMWHDPSTQRLRITIYDTASKQRRSFADLQKALCWLIDSA